MRTIIKLLKSSMSSTSLKLYDHPNGIILFCLLFALWAYNLGQSCPCDTTTSHPSTLCYRYEIFGVQPNHFVLFTLLGAAFPSYFVTFAILGAAFEYAEYLLDRNPEFVKKYIGGCLSKRPTNWPQKYSSNSHVFAHEKKHLHPMDEFFKIKNSTIHGWHGSIAEVFVNMAGFIVGMLINRFLYQ